MKSAMPCKVQNHQRRAFCGREPDTREIQMFIVEAHESTRKRLERTLPKDHENRIAVKGVNSLSHRNLVHKFIPMFQATKILDAKAAADKDRESSNNCQHGK